MPQKLHLNFSVNFSVNWGKLPQKGKTCFRCGEPGWTEEHIKVCKARKHQCETCGKLGHVEKLCRKGKKGSNQKVNRLDGDDESTEPEKTDSDTTNSEGIARVVEEKPNSARAHRVNEKNRGWERLPVRRVRAEGKTFRRNGCEFDFMLIVNGKKIRRPSWRQFCLNGKQTRHKRAERDKIEGQKESEKSAISKSQTGRRQERCRSKGNLEMANETAKRVCKDISLENQPIRLLREPRERSKQSKTVTRPVCISHSRTKVDFNSKADRTCSQHSNLHSNSNIKMFDNNSSTISNQSIAALEA